MKGWDTGAKKKELFHRLLINGLATIVLIFLIFFAQFMVVKWLYIGCVSVIGAIALWEYNRLVIHKGYSPTTSLSIAALILYLFSFYLKIKKHDIWELIPYLILGIFLFICFIYFAFRRKEPIINVATTFLGFIYIAVPMALILGITYYFPFQRRFEGSWWIAFLIAVTKSSDIGGYFIGRQYGKHKLASHLSPNKTLEGGIGGFCIAVLMSIFLIWIGKSLGFYTEVSYWQAFLLGIVVAIMGQLGDLVESALKRDAQVKDSNSLPGVGGVLDMIDSILFTTPIVYLFLKITYN